MTMCACVTLYAGEGCNVLKDTNTCYRTHSRSWRRIHTEEMMHTRVMEGVCTAGTLEEGEVVWQVRTRTRILHTQTRRSTAELHMYVLHRQREPCEYVLEELVSPVVKIPLCCRDVPLHGVQRFRRSTRRWYAVRFEKGEEHAAAEKEEPRTNEEAHSRHPQHSAEMSCDRRTSDRKYAAAELKDAVAAARRHGRPHGQDRTAEAQQFARSAVYPSRDINMCGVRCASVWCHGVVRSAV